MAAPSVQGTSATTSITTAATSQTLNLPGSISAGETLIIEVAHKAPAGEAAISGWTRFIDDKQTSGDTASISVFWKKATGSEGATVTFTTTTSTRVASIARRWGGTTDPTVTAPEGTTAKGLNSVNPDPPSYSIGISYDLMFVAVYACSEGNTASAYPTNYTTDQKTAGSGSTTVSHVGIGSAGRAVTGTTDNPGTFTHIGSGNEEWVAATYIIYPTGAGGGSTGSGTLTLQPISAARGRRIFGSDTGSLTGEAANWGLSPHRPFWWNTAKSRWDIVMPVALPQAVGASDWWICKDVTGVTTPMVSVDTRSNVRPDCRWDEANNKLYVWMGGLTGGSKMYTYDYDSGADTYTVDVNGVATGINSMGSDQGGSFTMTPNGHLWVAANDDTFGMSPAGISFAKSTDGGATWSSEVDLKTTQAVGKVSMTHFTYSGTTYLAICASENGLDVGTDDAIIHFLYIDQDAAGYATPANWTDETASIPAYSTAFSEADDESCITRDENNNLYIIAECEHLRINSGLDPQLVLFKRSAAGVWESWDLALFDSAVYSRKRPTITIDDANRIIHIFYNRENTVINYRSAPVANPALLATATEYTLFSDDEVNTSFRNPHSPANVTADSNMLVIADNQTRDHEWWTLIDVTAAEGTSAVSMTPSFPQAALQISSYHTGFALSATPTLPAGSLTAVTSFLGGIVVDISGGVSLPAGSLVPGLVGTPITATPTLPSGFIDAPLGGVVLTVTPSQPAGTVFSNALLGQTLFALAWIQQGNVQANTFHVGVTLTVTDTYDLPRGRVGPSILLIDADTAARFNHPSPSSDTVIVKPYGIRPRRWTGVDE